MGIQNNKTNKKGSIRATRYNSLIQSSTHSKRKYLNISVCFDHCVGMAEWSLQLLDTECPLWVVGSIPAADVFSKISLNNQWSAIN